MSRGKLDEETVARIEKQLPDVTDLRIATLNLQPDHISAGFPPQSTIPIAAICFQDVTSTLQEVRYALYESLSHLVWYREKIEDPNERLAVFFSRFYADDAALRLYATGEHLARAIVSMLEISNQELMESRKTAGRDGIASEQATVGKYLKAVQPNHSVTAAILKLVGPVEWRKTIAYRNEWVHSKPPIIEGRGIEYERRNRLKVSAGHIGISVGGGDQPRYSIEDLLGFIRPASWLFAETTNTILQYYLELLNKEHKPFWKDG